MRPVSLSLARVFGMREYWAEVRRLIEQRGKRAYFYWDELEQFFELAQKHGLIEFDEKTEKADYPVMLRGLLFYWRRYRDARAAGFLSAHDFYDQECRRGATPV